MTKTNPRMILFDYGQTLLHEARFDAREAFKALSPHLYPKENIDIERMLELSSELFDDLRELAFANSVEVSFESTFNFLLEMFDLSCDLPMLECEKLYWFSGCPAEAMPELQTTLDELEERGIRTAVISNISFSSAAMKARIDNHLDHNMEFVVTSSETILRKPEKWIFLSALQKSGLKAEECWYVGDNIYCDLEGALGVGMHPVWYDSGHDCFYPREDAEITAEMRPHIDIINNYSELLDLLD
ncbi:MAG: HAD family hydrolase [Eubacteriales bacterium]|nr:HAD family hydrolase [Eubacteriales bacterium]MDD4324070.1 HAD family hydrolase [Eubacteriales bacterium]MDD4541336.1 HAD family hydrolase [Eubacteriales bacterium]